MADIHEDIREDTREDARRLRLTLAYKGTKFQGWQLQAPVHLGRATRTVQGALEEALGAICGRPLRVHGSSRTDSGVHALHQVAHVDIPADRARVDWLHALNGLLPRDVCVLDARLVSPRFHARFDARSKIYTYSFWTSRRYVLPQRRPYVWACGPLDTARMEAAAACFRGEHDFAAFTNRGGDATSTVRTVTRLERLPPAGHWPDLPPFQEEQVWMIQASGFLKQMVRNIMGCLMAAGRGLLEPEAVPGLLEGRDRTAAPTCAPAQGLTLRRIFYDEDLGETGSDGETPA